MADEIPGGVVSRSCESVNVTLTLFETFYVISSISGVASSKVRVYACVGCMVTRSVGPTSISFPRYITAIRVAR